MLFLAERVNIMEFNETMVGYILSGDPTYITSYNGARGLIVKIERDELLEEFAKTYIKTL